MLKNRHLRQHIFLALIVSIIFGCLFFFLQHLIATKRKAQIQEVSQIVKNSIENKMTDAANMKNIASIAFKEATFSTIENPPVDSTGQLTSKLPTKDPSTKAVEHADTQSALDSSKKATPNFPILYYHCVSDKITGIKELFVSPAEFTRQMKYLKENGYQSLFFSDLSKISEYKNPVMITFDDGYENNYLEAYPILKKYELKATIFLTTDYVDKKGYLKAEEIRKMTDLISFEAHTKSHPDLTKLTDNQLDTELKEPIEIITKITGLPVIAFAYPTGFYNQKIIQKVKQNYQFAATNQSGLFTANTSAYEIKRVYIPRGTSIEKFKVRLAKGSLP